ncbi:MAG: flagellar biosynthetic protein FliO [Candidatus Eremiobacteraeota bacterium]|nr:flagellar biosynthetic protein FliO [Candidatus Eremiobacteraeota bacterium]MBV9409814.1 flagellar biosynthetic protein FliO [Candidatus Eremiobacteraeota bacterium]
MGSFVLQAIWALAVVALLLVGLTYVVRMLNRGRIVASTGKRLVSVVESTFLAQHTTVHVVKVGDRYYLIGGGSAGVTHIADIPADVVEPYIETQRKALGEQRDAVLRLLNTFRKRP